MINNPIEFIQTVDVIKKSTESLSKFSGLDLEVLSTTSQDSEFFCSLKKDPHKACCKTFQSPDCNKIPANLLGEITRTKKPCFFTCPYGMTKMAVPLQLNGEITGLFFAGENGATKLDKTKLDALSTLLSQLGNYVLESESVLLQHFKGNSVTHKQELLNKVIKSIWKNIYKPNLSLKEVAKENGVSYYYLSHLFKSELKTTFVEFRQKAKMQIAAKLLRDRRLTVDQIARTCGFEDSSYFCKTFKKIYKCTPGSFRQQFHKGKTTRKIGDFIKRHFRLRNFKTPTPAN